jgi:hypothetical protein
MMIPFQKNSGDGQKYRDGFHIKYAISRSFIAFDRHQSDNPAPINSRKICTFFMEKRTIPDAAIIGLGYTSACTSNL